MTPCGTDHPAWLASSGTESPSELACGQAALTATASGRNPASRTPIHAAAASAETARGMATCQIPSILPSPRSGLASPRRDWRISHTSEGCEPAAPLEYDPLTGLLPVWPRGGALVSTLLKTTVKTASTSSPSTLETRQGAEALPEGGARVPASTITHPRGMEGAPTPESLSSRYDALERPLSSRHTALERSYSSRHAALEHCLHWQMSDLSETVRTFPRAASAAVAEGAFAVQSSQPGTPVREDGACVLSSEDAPALGIEGADAPMLPSSRSYALETARSRCELGLEWASDPQPPVGDGAEDDMVSCDSVVNTAVCLGEPKEARLSTCLGRVYMPSRTGFYSDGIEGADVPSSPSWRFNALELCSSHGRDSTLEPVTDPQVLVMDVAEDDVLSCDTVVDTAALSAQASWAGEAARAIRTDSDEIGREGVPRILSSGNQVLELSPSCHTASELTGNENVPWLSLIGAVDGDPDDGSSTAALDVTVGPDSIWRAHAPASDVVVHDSKMPGHAHCTTGQGTNWLVTDHWPESASAGVGELPAPRPCDKVQPIRPVLRIYTGDDLEKAPWRTRSVNTNFVSFMRERLNDRQERLRATEHLQQVVAQSDDQGIVLPSQLRLGGFVLGCAALVLPGNRAQAGLRQEQRENRLVRRLRLPMPTYDGAEDLVAFEAFVYEWDDWILPLELSERRAVRLMSHALTGAAKDWYMMHVALDSYPWTLREIYAELWEVCFSDDFREELREELMNATQDGRPIKQFARKLQNLAIRFPEVGIHTLKRILWDGADDYIRLFWAEKGRSVEYDDMDTLMIYAQRAERRERLRQRILREISEEARSERPSEGEEPDLDAVQVSGARIQRERTEDAAELSAYDNAAEASEYGSEREYYASGDEAEEYESEGDYSGNDEGSASQEENNGEEADQYPETDYESGEAEEYDDGEYTEGEYEEEYEDDPGADNTAEGGVYRRRYYSEDGAEENESQYGLNEEYDGEYDSEEEYEEPAEADYSDEDYNSEEPRGSEAAEGGGHDYNEDENDQEYWSEGETESDDNY